MCQHLSTKGLTSTQRKHSAGTVSGMHPSRVLTLAAAAAASASAATAAATAPVCGVALHYCHHTDSPCMPLVQTNLCVVCLPAGPTQVSARAKKRGLPQMGTLGAGNHYAEVQVVDEIFDEAAARKMGIDTLGQVGHSRLYVPAS